jgi:hypothetical protein
MNYGELISPSPAVIYYDEVMTSRTRIGF